MAGYLRNTTDCDHCENEHNKPNKDAPSATVRHTMNAANEYINNLLIIFIL
jgi:hypothetical protein